MSMFVMTWPDRAEVAVCDEPTAAHAEDRLRCAAVHPLRAYGAPQVREIDPGALLTFHPMRPSRNPGEDPAPLKLEVHPGIAHRVPDVRFSGARMAWFDFQERVVALLDRYPALSGLVPPVVRAAWEAGTVSVFDVMVEVGGRVVPDLVDLEPSAVRAARTG